MTSAGEIECFGFVFGSVEAEKGLDVSFSQRDEDEDEEKIVGLLSCVMVRSMKG